MQFRTFHITFAPKQYYTMARTGSKSAQCATKCMYVVLQYLDEHGGFGMRKDIEHYVSTHVSFTYWESEPNGPYTHWQQAMRLGARAFEKAGYIERNGEIWTLTPDGKEVYDMGESAMPEVIDSVW